MDTTSMGDADATDEGVLVRLDDISKRYGGVQALSSVSVAFRAGELHALCGHNGAGKSTIVKILSGLTAPDEGHVVWPDGRMDVHSPQEAQRLGVALVHQELSVIPTLSIADNLLLGRVGAGIRRRRSAEHAETRRLLTMVGLDRVDPRDSLGRLQLGERQLVEIARALGRQARLLILDEPTAMLSEGEIEQVFTAARRAAADGACVLFVSHRLGEVLSLCSRVTVMRDGREVVTRQTAGLRRDELVTLMLGEHHTAPTLRPVPMPTSASGFSLRGVRVPPRVAEMDLDLASGMVVALAGQIGSGASETLRGIAGLVPGAAGTVTIAGRPISVEGPRQAFRDGIIYVTNDRKGEGLFLHQSVRANLVATRLREFTRLGFLGLSRMHTASDRLAEEAGVAAKADARAEHLSGGNQQKALIGRNLGHSGQRLVLLDEPTRGVDVGGRAAVHKLIRATADKGDAVLLASTDLDEILEVADVIVTMFGGRIVSTRLRAETSARQIIAEMTHKDEAEG